MRIVMGMVGLLIFGWGGLLLYYLASGHIPSRLQSVVHIWMRRDQGGDEGVNVALWVLFCAFAGAVLTIIGLSALISR
jgi:hypothetical protein